MQKERPCRTKMASSSFTGRPTKISSVTGQLKLNKRPYTNGSGKTVFNRRPEGFEPGEEQEIDGR